jgi:hypothetical protein
MSMIKGILNALTPVVSGSSSNYVLGLRLMSCETSEVFDQITVVFRVQFVFTSFLCDEFTDGDVFRRHSDDCLSGFHTSLVSFLYRHSIVLL